MKNIAFLENEYSELLEKFAFAEGLTYNVYNNDTWGKLIKIYFDSNFQMILKMQAFAETEERGFVYAWDKFDEDDQFIVNYSKLCKVEEFVKWVKEHKEEEYKKYLSEIED